MKYEIIHEEPVKRPVKEVVVHLSPDEVNLIGNALSGGASQVRQALWLDFATLMSNL